MKPTPRVWLDVQMVLIQVYSQYIFTQFVLWKNEFFLFSSKIFS